MAAHFHSLKIKEVIRETPDCVSLNFEVPQTLWKEFAYREGQNITIKATLNGEELRRSYSICAAPFECELKVAIKAADGGRFSRYAQTLKAGEILEVLPPVGKFNARLQPVKGHYLALVAGSGITPVLSILKHTLHMQPQSSFTIIYGNKNRKSIIFSEELEALKNKYLERLNFIHILSREKTDALLNYGRIGPAKIKELQAIIDFSKFDSVYICGPEEMIFESSVYLQSLGYPEKNIHFELFTTPGQLEKQKEDFKKEAVKDQGPRSSITVKLDGRSFSFDLSKKGQSILDAALAQGADLPFACKGGVCSTCKAKLVSGEVNMDVNYALEPEEVEQGYILTCQSHPVSENVVVDYDVK